MSSSGRTSFARVNRGKGPHHIIISRGALVCTFKVHPWLAWTAGVGGILFFALYIAATGYWVFRDDILAASIARQSRIRFVYEDRIAELRAQIDRVTSRQLLEQEAIDAKMQRLFGRQAALDARQDLLAGLDAVARKLGVAPTADGLATGAVPRPAAQADSIGDAPLRESRLFDAVADDPEERLGAVELSLDAMEKQQTAFVEAVAAKVTAKAARINTVIARLGHKLETLPAQGGVGGPYLPVADGPRSFRQGIAAATDGIEQLAALRAAARQLPLWRPLPGAAVTSGYGARLDPFLHRPSLHAGIDFRSEPGTAVRATARGRVTEAGLIGGYGNMVEVDHGNGLTTRYAHLSAISVEAGDAVDTGDVVGFVGTTGRSTGPHLHYEVRIEGEPIDPMRYIKAVGELRGILYLQPRGIDRFSRC